MIDVGFIRKSFDESKYSSFELLWDSWGAIIPKQHRLANEYAFIISLSLLVRSAGILWYPQFQRFSRFISYLPGRYRRLESARG